MYGSRACIKCSGSASVFEKEFEKELLPGRILGWSSDIGISSGILEKHIGAQKILPPRLVYLIRLKVSCFVSCSFAIDVNSWKYKEFNISPREIQGLQGYVSLEDISTFTPREVTALRYCDALSSTPVSFSGRLLTSVRNLFPHEEIVAIVTLASKVNYWARTIEAWRIKPIGYTDDPILKVDSFGTYHDETPERY